METFLTILNVLASGSLIATIATLRYKRKTAAQEAKTLEIDNANRLVSDFETHIANPLKTEVNELRKTTRSLQRAINKISDCPAANNCPVRLELQNNQDSHDHPTES